MNGIDAGVDAYQTCTWLARFFIDFIFQSLFDKGAHSQGLQLACQYVLMRVHAFDLQCLIAAEKAFDLLVVVGTVVEQRIEIHSRCGVACF